MKRSQIIAMSIVPILFAGGSGWVRAEIPSAYADPPDAQVSQAAQGDQSVYEKMQTVEPLDRQAGPATAPAVNPDDARKQYDDATAALNKATEAAEARVEKDPKIQSLKSTADDAKSKYDNEIDDALDVINDYDEYQELITAADKASNQSDFIRKNSPDNEQAIATADRRFADARRKVEDFEDQTLDQDKYVQQARQTFLAARDAYDNAVGEALAKDPTVKDARALADAKKNVLDSVAANQSKQPVESGPARLLAVASAPLSSNDQAVGGPDQIPPPVYDNGDSGGSGGAVYSPAPVYVQPSVVYVEPDAYYADYPGVYLDGYIDVRSRYHHYRDYDHGSHDYHGYRDWRPTDSGDNNRRAVRASDDERQRIAQREHDTRAEAIQNQRRAEAEQQQEQAAQVNENRDANRQARARQAEQADRAASENAQRNAQAEAQARADAQARAQQRQARAESAARDQQAQAEQSRAQQRQQQSQQQQQRTQDDSDSGRHSGGSSGSSHAQNQNQNNSNDGNGRSHR